LPTTRQVFSAVEFCDLIVFAELDSLAVTTSFEGHISAAAFGYACTVLARFTRSADSTNAAAAIVATDFAVAVGCACGTLPVLARFTRSADSTNAAAAIVATYFAFTVGLAAAGAAGRAGKAGGAGFARSTLAAGAAATVRTTFFTGAFLHTDVDAEVVLTFLGSAAFAAALTAAIIATGLSVT
jgi:hypothetical protein